MSTFMTPSFPQPPTSLSIMTSSTSSWPLGEWLGGSGGRHDALNINQAEAWFEMPIVSQTPFLYLASSVILIRFRKCSTFLLTQECVMNVYLGLMTAHNYTNTDIALLFWNAGYISFGIVRGTIIGNILLPHMYLFLLPVLYFIWRELLFCRIVLFGWPLTFWWHHFVWSWAAFLSWLVAVVKLHVNSSKQKLPNWLFLFYTEKRAST